jgi:hypothetical protein
MGSSALRKKAFHAFLHISRLHAPGTLQGVDAGRMKAGEKSTMELASPTALACLRRKTSGEITLSLLKLKPDQTPSRACAELRIDFQKGAKRPSPSAQIRRFLSGTRIGHFRQGGLDPILRFHAGAVPSFGLIDLGMATDAALERRGEGGALPTLSQLARRQGYSSKRIVAATTNSAAAVSLLADLCRVLIFPDLALTRGRYDHREHVSDRPISPDELSLLAGMGHHTPPMHSKALLRPPNPRRAPWSTGEALDCALRFASGASLQDLSDLTGRTPGAIEARLTLDGILRREGTTKS